MPERKSVQNGRSWQFGRKDAVFLGLIAAVLLVIVMISGPETTRRVPRTEHHLAVYAASGTTAKKQLEKSCQDCHGTNAAPLPVSHPAGARCLICHRLEKGAP